jgi:hypothetical protein
MKKILVAILVFWLAQKGLSELPPHPSLEKLVESSEMIVAAEPANTIDVNASINLQYQIISFRIHNIYKGYPITDPILIQSMPKKTILGPIINVIVQKQGLIERRIPKYKNGTQYILFLGDPILESLYGRSKVDELWEETCWTQKKEEKIKYILSCTEDDIIPKDAKEKIVEIRNEQGGIYRKAEYWKEISISPEKSIGEEKVGERGWYENGNLAYEYPMIKGRKNGKCKEYYTDSKMKSESYYRDGILHGIFKGFSSAGEPLKETFWFSGKQISKEEYEKVLKEDDSLPILYKNSTDPNEINPNKK